jgi:hypothetical protein
VFNLRRGAVETKLLAESLDTFLKNLMGSLFCQPQLFRDTRKILVIEEMVDQYPLLVDWQVHQSLVDNLPIEMSRCLSLLIELSPVRELLQELIWIRVQAACKTASTFLLLGPSSQSHPAAMRKPNWFRQGFHVRLDSCVDPRVGVSHKLSPSVWVE